MILLWIALKILYILNYIQNYDSLYIYIYICIVDDICILLKPVLELEK